MRNYNPKIILLGIVFFLLLAVTPGQAQLSTKTDTTDTTGQVEKQIDLVSDSLVVETTTPDTTETPVRKLLYFFLVIAIAYFLMSATNLGEEKLVERYPAHEKLLKRTNFSINFILGLLVLYFIGSIIYTPSMESIYVLTGILGLAVALALNENLKNLFGGIGILFRPMFQIGDKIMIADFEGIVVEISLAHTKLMTTGDIVIFVPNRLFYSDTITNYNSGAPDKMVQVDIYLPASTETSLLRKAAARAASSSQFVFHEKPVSVFFASEVDAGRTVLKMSVCAYVFDLQYEQAFSSEITEFILGHLTKKHGPDSVRAN